MGVFSLEKTPGSAGPPRRTTSLLSISHPSRPRPHLPNPMTTHRVRKGTLGCPPRLPEPPPEEQPSPDVDISLTHGCVLAGPQSQDRPPQATADPQRPLPSTSV